MGKEHPQKPKPTLSQLAVRPRRTSPRFTASKKRASVPGEAAEIWAENDKAIKIPFNHRRIQDDKVQTLLQDMQAYARGDPVRTQGSNVLYKGMDPVRLKDHAPVATSTRPDVAMQFAPDGDHKKLYRIHVPDGTVVMPIGLDFEEHEMLLMPGRLRPRRPPPGNRSVERFHLGRTRSGRSVSETRSVHSLDYRPSLGRSGRPTLNPHDSQKTLSMSSGHRYSPASSFAVSQQSGDSPTASTAASRGASQRKLTRRRRAPRAPRRPAAARPACPRPPRRRAARTTRPRSRGT